ncbi:FtsK/SpoIIIE domain-containing protein [Bacillus cereus group sp. MYBK15-3]|uniref:FtsK/SpoIIIE domain-containing protein n=1 Tax=unclassified Bacillus cereus group TaxID=2750818 RepID=UPI003F79510A
MINFSDRHLYEVEQGKYNQFLKKKLETKTEYNQNSQYSEGDEDEPGFMMEDVIGGEGFSFGSDEDDGWGVGSEGLGGGWSGAEPGDKSGVATANDWRKENFVKTWLMSPIYLVNYVFTDIIKDCPKKEEWEHILTALNKINVGSAAVAVFVMLLGLNSPFTPSVQLFVAVISFLATSYALKALYNKGIFAKEDENAESEESNLEEDDEEGGGEFDFEALNFSGEGVALDDEFGAVLADEYEEEEEDDLNEGKYSIGASPISIQSDQEFYDSLLDVFAEGNKHRGRVINERIALLRSFAPYIITNDRNFGKYKRPKERGVEYNNIAYAIFKGLVAVDSKFEKDENKLTVLDIKHSPLLYKVEVVLPSYFKADMIQRKIDAFEDMLKASTDDKEVSVLVSFYQGRFVFKFIRFDSRTLVSLGDILRFQGDASQNGTALEQFADENKGLPILLGLQDNESPYVIDFENNTSGTIVGGSGSGKSWLTFSLMWNFVLANSYDSVQFIVMDAKRAPFWESFARMPHVLGYHYDISTFLEILLEVEEERKRRQELMTQYGAEDLKGLRKALRKKGDYETMKKFPLLIVIMDEITATMLEYEERDDDKEMYMSVRNIMGTITAKGRSAGVRILTIGQRSIDKSVPKTVMANSSFKFGMRMDAMSDFTTMFGEEIKKVKKPNMMGMGLASTFDYSGFFMLKTLTLGGTNNEQMLALIRVVALDWLRRAAGNTDLTVPPEGMNFPKAFNRNEYVAKSLQELREGKILNAMTVSRGYALDLEDEDAASKLAPVGMGVDLGKDAVDVPLYDNAPTGYESKVSLEKDEISIFNKDEDIQSFDNVEDESDERDNGVIDNGSMFGGSLDGFPSFDEILENTNDVQKDEETNFKESQYLTEEDNEHGTSNLNNEPNDLGNGLADSGDDLDIDNFKFPSFEDITEEVEDVPEDADAQDLLAAFGGQNYEEDEVGHSSHNPPEQVNGFEAKDTVEDFPSFMDILAHSDTDNGIDSETSESKLSEIPEPIDVFGDDSEDEGFTLDDTVIEAVADDFPLVDVELSERRSETDTETVGEELVHGSESAEKGGKINLPAEKVNIGDKFHSSSEVLGFSVEEDADRSNLEDVLNPLEDIDEIGRREKELQEDKELGASNPNHLKQPTVNLSDILGVGGKVQEQKTGKEQNKPHKEVAVQSPVPELEVKLELEQTQKPVVSPEPKLEVDSGVKPKAIEVSAPKKEPAPVGAVKVAYDSPTITRNEEPQETVEQYIFNNGTKIDMFSYCIAKDDLHAVYPKKKIDKALNMTLIFDDGDVYVAEK